MIRKTNTKRNLAVSFFLILGLISYGQAQEKLTKNLSNSEVRVLIDSLKQNLIRFYIFPDQAKNMSKYLDAQFKNGAYKRFSNPAKLSQKLTSDINTVYYDSHLKVNFEPGLIAPKMMSPADIAQARKEALVVEKDDNFNLQKAEILPGNIGYFLFNGFTGNVAEAKPFLNGALTFLSGTKALIIDLRTNGGGNSNNRLENYFFKDKTHLFDQVNTINKDTIAVYADPKITNGPSLLMPVYILTSKATFSAAEAFSSTMQSFRRATIIGDTTGGGSHMTGFFDLNGGFIARIPFAKPVSTPIFKDWEGTGVIPDVPVKAAEALHKAQEVIYRNLMTNAKNDQEKRRISWALNTIIAEQKPKNLNSALYAQYVGTYSGGLEFYMENDQLVCRNKERGVKDAFKLKPVSDRVFLLDESVQIEFIEDVNGRYSSLLMLWKSGDVTKKMKE